MASIRGGSARRSTIGVALAKFWKLILIGVAGVGVALKKFFGRKDDSASS